MVASEAIKPEPKESTGVLLYTSIHQLPLTNFIACMVDHQLTELIISGHADEDVLRETWADILQQYTEAIGSSGDERRKSLIRQITRQQINLHQVESCINILSDYHVPFFAKKLNSLLHTSFAFDVNQPAEYSAELKRCENRSKGLSLDIRLNQMTLESLIAATPADKSEPVSKEYFDNILISLSDHAGFEISEDKLTVYKFCERIKRFNKHWEARKNKIDSKKNKTVTDGRG